MDVLPLLRTYRDDLPEVDDARLDAIRARLDAGIGAAARPRPRLLTPPLLIAGLGAATAAVLVAALVAAGPAPKASAAAVRVLDAAAGAAGAAGAVRTVVLREEGLSERLDGAGRVVAAYNARTVRTIRVPAGDGSWTRTSWSETPDEYFGGAAAHALAQEEGALAPVATRAHPQVERSADGTFTNGELGGGDVLGDDPAALRALPTDPAALLVALRNADVGVDDRGEAAHVLAAASTVLRSGVAGARLQAAVFSALRFQEGLTVVDRSAALDGRVGVAIGEARPSWRFESHQLVIDPATGAYLGDRDVALLPQGVVPAGTIVASTTVLRR